MRTKRLPAPMPSPAALYKAERTFLDQHTLIPLLSEFAARLCRGRANARFASGRRAARRISPGLRWRMRSLSLRQRASYVVFAQRGRCRGSSGMDGAGPHPACFRATRPGRDGAVREPVSARVSASLGLAVAASVDRLASSDQTRTMAIEIAQSGETSRLT